MTSSLLQPSIKNWSNQNRSISFIEAYFEIKVKKIFIPRSSSKDIRAAKQKDTEDNIVCFLRNRSEVYDIKQTTQSAIIDVFSPAFHGNNKVAKLSNSFVRDTIECLMQLKQFYLVPIYRRKYVDKCRLCSSSNKQHGGQQRSNTALHVLQKSGEVFSSFNNMQGTA